MLYAIREWHQSRRPHREQRNLWLEWIITLGGYEDAVRSAVAYVKKGAEDWPAWVDDLDALADDLRDGTAETKEQIRGDA